MQYKTTISHMCISLIIEMLVVMNVICIQICHKTYSFSANKYYFGSNFDMQIRGIEIYLHPKIVYQLLTWNAKKSHFLKKWNLSLIKRTHFEEYNIFLKECIRCHVLATIWQKKLRKVKFPNKLRVILTFHDKRSLRGFSSGYGGVLSLILLVYVLDDQAMHLAVRDDLVLVVSRVDGHVIFHPHHRDARAGDLAFESCLSRNGVHLLVLKVSDKFNWFLCNTKKNGVLSM